MVDLDGSADGDEQRVSQRGRAGWVKAAVASCHR